MMLRWNQRGRRKEDIRRRLLWRRFVVVKSKVERVFRRK
jgi:hypothetical protein